MTLKVVSLPYVPPRKKRKPEHLGFLVKYGRPDGDTIYFQWFKRDSAAVAFLNERIANGDVAHIVMQ